MAIYPPPSWNQPLPEWLSCNRLRPSMGSASTPFDGASRLADCPPPASASGSFASEPRNLAVSSGRFRPATGRKGAHVAARHLRHNLWHKVRADPPGPAA